MPTALQWLVAGLTFAGFAIFIGYVSIKQVGMTESVALVDPVSETVALGAYRGEVTDEGEWDDPIPTIDREELLANTMADTMAEQYNTKYDVLLSYGYVDEDGNLMDVGENVDASTLSKLRGIQYNVRLVEPGKTESNGEAERIMYQDTLADHPEEK